MSSARHSLAEDPYKRKRKERIEIQPSKLNFDVHGILFAIVAVVFVFYRRQDGAQSGQGHGPLARRPVPGLVGPRQFRGHRRPAPRWLHCAGVDVLDDGARVGSRRRARGKTCAAGLRRARLSTPPPRDTNLSITLLYPVAIAPIWQGWNLLEASPCRNGFIAPLQPLRILPRNLRVRGPSRTLQPMPRPVRRLAGHAAVGYTRTTLA